MASETERIAERRTNGAVLSLLESEIQIVVDFFVYVFGIVVDCGRHDILFDGLNGEHGFQGAGSTQKVSCHRLGGRYVEIVSVVSEYFLDGLDFADVADRGRCAVIAMTEALKDANMQPDEIDYINVHGTSTPVGDISEVKAIQEVFGEHAYQLNISSTKSMTGHMLGAAGAVEAIISILAIKNSIVPPTINHEEDDKDENIDYNLNFTFNKPQKREINVALSNTFGFGGHNACLLFRKYAE